MRSEFQAVRSEEEVQDIDDHMAVLVAPENTVRAGDDDFLEGVADLAQRAVLLFAFFVVIHSERGLYVVSLTALVGHEIHLELLADGFSGSILSGRLENADIDIEAS